MKEKLLYENGFTITDNVQINKKNYTVKRILFSTWNLAVVLNSQKMWVFHVRIQRGGGGAGGPDPP